MRMLYRPQRPDWGHTYARFTRQPRIANTPDGVLQGLGEVFWPVAGRGISARNALPVGSEGAAEETPCM